MSQDIIQKYQLAWFIGKLTLYFAGIIGFLMLMTVAPGGHVGMSNHWKSNAKNDLIHTITAIKGFYAEYSLYPRVGREIDGDFEISGSSQRDLYFILRNMEPGREKTVCQNTKGIVFFEANRSKKTPPKNGFGPDEILYDPIGNSYRFVIDGNGDGRVAVPVEWKTRDPGKIIETPVIGFSPGKKTEDLKDDVVTW